MTDTKQLDLEKLEKLIQNVDMGQFAAFEDDSVVDSIKPNLESIKKNLNEYDKVFLELGFWGYDDEFSDEPTYMIDGDPWDVTDEIDESDSYYDKYHYLVAGYGIFVDKDFNVEYGYYTTEAPPSGHGAGYNTIHDFKDAIEGDEIKEKIYSLLDKAKIWESEY